ncbi:hypothetical protein QJS04_geneDACA008121 [Acorus gramineus]|uniref:GDT1 family protein n=1 Tax=Acorus gramineus TaxID=55184 RepID=A0AAV9B0R3_ACOGR|nr:hypothetical protein QJS04_geneDACA008121 [Acorus gramineus]
MQVRTLCESVLRPSHAHPPFPKHPRPQTPSPSLSQRHTPKLQSLNLRPHPPRYPTVLQRRMIGDKSLNGNSHFIGNPIIGEYATDSLQHSVIPLHVTDNGLKFALLFGLLYFQSSQPAIAASLDFAGVVQSIGLTGDFSDITTGFASAFLLIFFSELGDKTFFIAALLAARNSGPIVFIGTFGALAAMTIVSVILGRTFHYVDAILPFRFGETDLPIDDIAAAFLLVYFGVSTLLDAYSDNSSKIEEEQSEAELAISEFSGNGAGIMAAASTVVSTFILVFVAEWGDKSFFSTIALAAASSPLGVVGGALAGHAVATLIAVIGGSLLGTFLSEKVIAYTGGSLFLVFALLTIIDVIR